MIGGRGHFTAAHLTDLFPTTIKVILDGTFRRCSQLTTVNLGEGLEGTEALAFGECVSTLQKISIPSTVKTIHHLAFWGSSSLTNILFCDEIEHFVSRELMREWWNHRVHRHCLITYCFMKKFNFLERLGLLPVMQWQENIHGMLRIIPAIPPQDSESHFDSIHSKLDYYEKN